MSLGQRRTARIVVTVGSGSKDGPVVEAGARLAEALKADWEAVYIETPADLALDKETVAAALRRAAELGASVAKLSAAQMAPGLLAHLEATAAGHLVIGVPRRRRLWFRRSLVDEIVADCPAVILHLVPAADCRPAPAPTASGDSGLPSYAYAVGGAAMTVLAALLLRLTAGVEFLSFLFLFPVIAAAARLGIRQAIAAAVASAAAFNFFFLVPAYAIKPMAVQSWIMTAALVLVAVYTGALTTNLRGRALLSERSAQESSGIATFASELARAAEWNSTAQVICCDVARMLDVQTLLLRPLGGSLEVVAGAPEKIVLDPLDRTALEWAWTKGEPAGSGTSAVSAAGWRFEPLKTSLATLAVLGLARADGGDPVPAERKLLLSTLVSQSALALERLRLEDMMKAAG